MRLEAAPARLFELFAYIVAQHYGVVVLSVVRAVEQNDVARTRGSGDRCPSVRMVIQLRAVPALELGPFGHVVPEPAAQ